MSNIHDAINSVTGSYIISVILGLGLAALFRKACKDNNCIVIKGPAIDEVNKHFYKINDNCYRYSPVFTECTQ
jgi:hypothetical protein